MFLTHLPNGMNAHGLLCWVASKLHEVRKPNKGFVLEGYSNTAVAEYPSEAKSTCGRTSQRTVRQSYALTREVIAKANVQSSYLVALEAIYLLMESARVALSRLIQVLFWGYFSTQKVMRFMNRQIIRIPRFNPKLFVLSLLLICTAM